MNIDPEFRSSKRSRNEDPCENKRKEIIKSIVITNQSTMIFLLAIIRYRMSNKKEE